MGFRLSADREVAHSSRSLRGTCVRALRGAPALHQRAAAAACEHRATPRARPSSDTRGACRLQTESPCAALLPALFREVSCAAIHIRIWGFVVGIGRFAHRLADSRAAGGSLLIDLT